MRIIPAIDLKDGKCVRLLQGDFAKATEYSNNPSEVAHRFSALQVGELHVVDLDGARVGTQQNRDAIATIVGNTRLDVQLGGGLRSARDVSAWLDVGVSRCVIGSLAATQPEQVGSWFEQFGGNRLVLAFDVRISNDVPYLTTHGWTTETDITLWDALDTYAASGLEHVLCTDVDRDGALVGPNVALYSDIMRRYPDLNLQASGGVRDIGDLADLRAAGLPAAITGRAMLDGRITPAEVVSFRQSA